MGIVRIAAELESPLLSEESLCSPATPSYFTHSIGGSYYREHWPVIPFGALFFALL